ncbi:MAG: O-antigen ligase domain-containing protein [Phycisphaerae bacterium]|nr:O-antigen ligase domain-containing protein [Phycisphaerae bacterium]
MTLTVYLALFAWPVLTLFLFAAMPSLRATVVSMAAGWMFLPVAGFKLPGLPDYTKLTAISLGVLLGTLVFDPARLGRLRPRWFDVPMLVWWLVPMASSITNGLGAYDGGSSMMKGTEYWVIPYLIGRLYFSDAAGLRELAMGMIVGGLVYVPLCLFEARMSPQLHTWVYGYHQHQFIQSWRFGGWRPTVFMQHGLMVAAWMATASLVGVWMWRVGELKRLRGWPFGWLLAALVGTTLLCRSVGAIALLAAGLGAMTVARTWRITAAVWVLATVPFLYVGVRVVSQWDASELIAVSKMISSERAESLKTRIDNENQLIARAMERPVFGWGLWGRARIIDEEEDQDLSRTDGMWIIALGNHGVVGLGAFFGWLILPPALLLWRAGPGVFKHPGAAPAVAVLVSVLLFTIDTLPNSMINPLLVAAAGGLGPVAMAVGVRRGVGRAGAGVPRGVPAVGGAQGGGA